MKTILAALAAAMLCLGPGAAPVLAQDADDPILGEAMTFALHDAAFTMYHEIGHLLVGELGLPVLGKEEDAVDAWATIWLLEFDESADSYDALIKDCCPGAYKLACNVVTCLADRLRRMDEWTARLLAEDALDRRVPEWNDFRQKLFRGWNV